MQETHTESPLITKDGTQPQEGGTRRRIASQPCDLSQADLNKPEIRRSLAAGADVLLSYATPQAPRRVQD